MLFVEPKAQAAVPQLRPSQRPLAASSTDGGSNCVHAEPLAVAAVRAAAHAAVAAAQWKVYGHHVKSGRYGPRVTHSL